MIAGGTGITPLYQLIQYMSETQKEQHPNVTLIFANKTESDILLRKELETFASGDSKFKLYFSVDNPQQPETWDGFVGFLDEEKISKTLPAEEEIKNTLFLSCGPPRMCNLVEKIWMDKKIPLNQVHRFW